jgi:hypothetical protein
VGGVVRVTDARDDLGRLDVDPATSEAIRDALSRARDRSTDYRPAVDELYVKWARVVCPECGLAVDVLEPVTALIVCARCPGRPRLERGAA